MIGFREVTLFAVGAVTATLTACSARACSGLASLPPSVQLDLSAWARSHPRTTLQACAGAYCETVSSAAAAQPVIIHVLRATSNRAITVTVAADKDGRPILRTSSQVRLVYHTEKGPCGDNGWWQKTRLTLTATGRLE